MKALSSMLEKHAAQLTRHDLLSRVSERPFKAPEARPPVYPYLSVPEVHTRTTLAILCFSHPRQPMKS